jgi:hypothetical protein
MVATAATVDGDDGDVTQNTEFCEHVSMKLCMNIVYKHYVFHPSTSADPTAPV